MNDRSPTNDRPMPMPTQIQGIPQMPEDARRMGLDATTPAGQQIMFAASLNPKKRSHKMIAWVMLLAMSFPLIIWLLTQITG